MTDSGYDRSDALRPLWAAADRTAALRAGTLEGDAERTAILDIAEAVERSLRRLLRDAPDPPLPIRLRALDRDELRSDEVLAELRQHDLISIELAASVHELFETRGRLNGGQPPQPGDRPLAIRTVDRLEAEASAPPQPLAARSVEAAPEEDGLDETVVQTRRRAPELSGRKWAGIAGALVLLGVLALGVLRFAGGGDDGELARGIALFRSGSYADAAAHFWRHSQDHPQDATPHLYLARIHRRMRRPDLAAAELREALRLAPGDAGVQSELGFLLLDAGRYDVAMQRFRAALRIDPEAGEAWIGLVRALEGSGRPDAARRVQAQAPERVREMLARRGTRTPGGT